MATKPKPITAFTGEYSFLSNFYSFAIVSGGIAYPTLEHAFQAHKSLSNAQREYIASCPTPGIAKREGRHIRLRADWEEYKDKLMLMLLKKKFKEGSELAQRLLDTGNALLIEGNTWGDTYWGAICVNRTTPWDGEKEVACWDGENRLGKLLMQVRDELRV